MKLTRLLGTLSIVAMLSLLILNAEGQKPQKPDRQALSKAMENGNFKEAYDGFAALALDPADDPENAGRDLDAAVLCLLWLGRTSEVDDLLEKAVEVHQSNWRVLAVASDRYASIEHSGVIVAGKFVRGPHRGGPAKYVNSFERDRVRAMRLLLKAIDAARAAKASPTRDISPLYTHLAFLLERNASGRGASNDAWRLQYLTDLTVLPDYDESAYYRGGPARGAPVEPDGTPVYHHLPKSWEDAKNDGEHWRWCLAQAVEYDPNAKMSSELKFAQFLRSQFDVQTLAEQPWFFKANEDEAETKRASIYSLHTLGDDETIARLATGIKRFKLPEEFSFIKIYQRLAAGPEGATRDGLAALATIYEDRQQYSKAAEYWRRAAREYPNFPHFQQRLEQIVGNWGQFETAMTQPAGKGATVEFRFRNGKKVSFEAREVNTKKLLDDVKAYLKSAPRQLSWEQVDIQDVGSRLIQRNQTQYIGARAAQWTLDLTPRPDHFDRRITVTTPLQKAGAYLLTARMDGGNESRIVLWVADTAIVKKPLENGAYYFVADAVTGQPVAKANVEFFGFWQEWIQDRAARTSRTVLHTANFAEFTDADGQLMPRNQDTRYQWIIIATTPEGRFAYLGFTSVWQSRYHEQEYRQTKSFIITDRPVYRPEQTVKFKVWVGHAQYDQEGKSAYADRDVTVRLMNPRGEKILEKIFRTDEYGGLAGEFALEKEAMLGVYTIFLPGHGGGNSFRVEEYKKPEFEVSVQAPAEPVMLGDKITAKIQAKYYFGAPVTEAKVHYKILRSSYSANWYPVDDWDWMYGPGYWWFSYDYVWYPGWHKWGCPRPVPIWWGWRPQQQPELVADAEVPIGKDGIVNVDIDTALAKEMQGDTDHRYEITAEVTDQSRRTIVGRGAVIAAREPFKVYAWVDRGYYLVGDVIRAGFCAQTPDNKPVQGKGELTLLRVTYDKEFKPVETQVQRWDLPTNDRGRAELQIKATQAGQYRLSYKVTDAKDHTLEGGYLFCIRGEGFDGSAFRFNDLELIQDKRDYKPGDKVNLMINTNRAGTSVVLFIRPSNGVYLPPKVIRLTGKSTVEQVEVAKKDMPNFFVEGFTVSDGKIFAEVREITVPPESRVLNVDVTPSAPQYQPGQKATVKVKLTDTTGEPYVGSLAVSIYDKAVEYISGGANVPEIKAFFWKWRRQHYPQRETTLDKGGYNIVRRDETRMSFIGAFGRLAADEDTTISTAGGEGGLRRESMPGAPPMAMAADKALGFESKAVREDAQQTPMVEPTIRTNFADTALWIPSLTTNKQGEATVELTMPENLTTWKARVWAMGQGTRVGEGTAEVVTTKNLIVRLQAPRFFVEKDDVVLSANVHNYLKTRKSVQVILELEGGCLVPAKVMNTATGETEEADIANPDHHVYPATTVNIDPNAEQRVDWRVKVVKPGEATVRVKALTDEESDAMQMSFPVYVHGMLKTESFSGVIPPPRRDSANFAIRVPAERKPEQSRLEIRYSPTLAGAMVDALPYLADYPYGCTEQTLNRFLPSVITQRTLQRMGLDLKEIQRKRTNLNAQEIGSDVERAKQWKRFEDNPVFDADEVNEMVKAGVNRLTSMQCADGGWGWFSGWGEQSYPHTTALVVHGLQIARDNDVAIVPGVLERGVEWLKDYQAKEVEKLRNAEKEKEPWKQSADNLDAFVYMVLVDAKADSKEMRDFLYRDRNNLAVYAKAMFALALHKAGDVEKRDMLMQNIAQYLVQDDENQTAYLRLPESNYWWCWYGSEIEADAYYLKLLAGTEPKSEVASRLVKYLINNRKHGTFWNSTRDTAVCIEAFADYLKASGEDKPDMILTVLIDGRPVKEVTINRENLFVFDNKLVLEGQVVTTGEHKIELRRKGTGPVYFNAYLTNFTLEDPITKAGLEIKVNRKYYKLTPADKSVKAQGSSGQPLDQKVEKYERTELPNLALLKSGDLAEIELEIDSKNDYEYIIFEDMKPAGFEPVEVRSGYNGNEMRAYVEFRDNRVTFFVRMLARGKHSVSYRMRAEIPGKFSALPTTATGMYAPELKANSDEIKLRVED